MSAADHLRMAAARLEAAGVPGATGDARRLLAHAMGVAPGRLTLHLGDALEAEVATRFDGLVARREAREPVSHLVGRRAFFGRDFAVGPAVLDPRPETETLILAALERPFDTVLDLGTGSGCILLTLLAERAAARGLGTDRSTSALQVAAQNAARLGLTQRADWAMADWLDGVRGRFDLIVSNPPYIAMAEMPDLPPELRFEPRGALTDEGDGLNAYRAITRGAIAHLAPSGWLVVEIGPTQGAEVTRMLRAAGLDDVQTRPDLDGRSRVVMGQAPASPG